jgi:hypothetical protein
MRIDRHNSAYRPILAYFHYFEKKIKVGLCAHRAVCVSAYLCIPPNINF